MLLSIVFAFSTLNGSNILSTEKMNDILTGKVQLLKDKHSPKEISINDDSNVLIPKKPPLSNLDRDTNLKYQESLQAYYEYKRGGFEHRSKVFEWQLFSSKLLFIIVIVLVFAGIYFAAVQFYAGLKEKKEKSEATKLSLSSSGIEVSSPVIGLIILTLSLGFFYLYLVYVFPIEEIF